MTDDEFEKICLALDWQRLFGVLKSENPARKIFVSALIEVCHPDETCRKSHGLARYCDKKLSNIPVEHFSAATSSQVDLMDFVLAYVMTEIFDKTDIALKIQNALRSYVQQKKLYFAKALVTLPLLDPPTNELIKTIFGPLELTPDERMKVKADEHRLFAASLIDQLFDLKPGTCNISTQHSKLQIRFTEKKPRELRGYSDQLVRLGINAEFVNCNHYPEIHTLFRDLSYIQVSSPLAEVIDKITLMLDKKSESTPDLALLEEQSSLREMSNP